MSIVVLLVLGSLGSVEFADHCLTLSTTDHSSSLSFTDSKLFHFLMFLQCFILNTILCCSLDSITSYMLIVLTFFIQPVVHALIKGRRNKKTEHMPLKAYLRILREPRSHEMLPRLAEFKSRWLVVS